MNVKANLETLVLMRRVRDRIDREYAQPLDVEALARGVHISAGHLHRSFVSAYGESPYQYLMTRRIERAMTLLRTTDMPVSDICFTVGYGSVGTFTTRFSELIGVPPTAYRDSGAVPLPGMPGCIVRAISRPVRNQEARPHVGA